MIGFVKLRCCLYKFCTATTNCTSWPGVSGIPLLTHVQHIIKQFLQDTSRLSNLCNLGLHHTSTFHSHEPNCYRQISFCIISLRQQFNYCLQACLLKFGLIQTFFRTTITFRVFTPVSRYTGDRSTRVSTTCQGTLCNSVWHWQGVEPVTTWLSSMTPFCCATVYHGCTSSCTSSPSCMHIHIHSLCTLSSCTVNLGCEIHVHRSSDCSDVL